MSKNQEQLKANLAKLPDLCYGVLNTTHEIIVIKKGETGYYATDWPAAKTAEDANGWCNEMNDGLGVTRAQRNAMEHGSMFGFDCLAADPDNEINQRV